MENLMFDVVAVNMKTLNVRMIAENKTQCNAEAVKNMTVRRRGIAEEFFATVKHGAYKEGDQWKRPKSA